MQTDRHGNRVTGATPDAITDFDRALGEFNLYRGDPIATIDRVRTAAIERHPGRAETVAAFWPQHLPSARTISCGFAATMYSPESCG